jgi:hypothetical protein
MAARSLLTIYENGPAVKSIVGAPPGLVSLVASGQTPTEPADNPTAGSRSPKSSVSATGRSYDASRIGSRTKAEEPTDSWVSTNRLIPPRSRPRDPATPRRSPLAQNPDASYRDIAAPAWACSQRLIRSRGSMSPPSIYSRTRRGA